MSGGWFDAGDFNKYVTFAYTAVHNLLWSYRENPDVFKAQEWNLPSSDSSGLPDVLKEVQWELDWLLKMNSPEDGSTILKMGSIAYDDNSQIPPDSKANLLLGNVLVGEHIRGWDIRSRGRCIRGV